MKTSLPAENNQLFSDPGHGDIKPVEDLVGIGPGWDLRVEKDFFLEYHYSKTGTLEKERLGMESFLKQIQRIKSGLPITFFNRISKDIGLPEKHLARIINTSTSTLAVRKKTGVFSFSESERLFRIRRIYNRAMEIFQDRELTKKWLKEPNWQLGGTAPIDFIDTEIGAREVENLLGRLEHGIFS